MRPSSASEGDKLAGCGAYCRRIKGKWLLTNRTPCDTIAKHLRVRFLYRGVEQLEARRAHNPEVVGSSPASATIKSPEIIRFQDFFLRFYRRIVDTVFCVY